MNNESHLFFSIPLKHQFSRYCKPCCRALVWRERPLCVAKVFLFLSGRGGRGRTLAGNFTSRLTSLPLKDQVTKHTTVKWLFAYLLTGGSRQVSVPRSRERSRGRVNCHS